MRHLQLSTHLIGLAFDYAQLRVYSRTSLIFAIPAMNGGQVQEPKQRTVGRCCLAYVGRVHSLYYVILLQYISPSTDATMVLLLPLFVHDVQDANLLLGGVDVYGQIRGGASLANRPQHVSRHAERQQKKL